MPQQNLNPVVLSANLRNKYSTHCKSSVPTINPWLSIPQEKHHAPVRGLSLERGTNTKPRIPRSNIKGGSPEFAMYVRY